MRLISIVEYPKKMRKMKIYSNQPGVQFYTGNFLPRNGMIGKVQGWMIVILENYFDVSRMVQTTHFMEVFV